jgi:DNA-binding PadR family transcriptional regulator
MQTTVYILGLLWRYGPQHGYQLKKHIREQLADFTHIKLPLIYYHLGRMAKAGWLSASAGKDSHRPPKTVYTITTKGKKHFRVLLKQLTDFAYQTEFASDAIFYFSDIAAPGRLQQNLENQVGKMERLLAGLRHHQQRELAVIPKKLQQKAVIIFDHHMRHYQAELGWARETLKSLRT